MSDERFAPQRGTRTLAILMVLSTFPWIGGCSPPPKRKKDLLDSLDPVSSTRFPVPEVTTHSVRPRGFDLQHGDLGISLDVDRASLEGVAVWTLQPSVDRLREVALDLGASMKVERVHAAMGQALEFSHEGDLLRIALDRAYSPDEELVISIAYSGVPRAGMYFRESEEGPVVFTHGQPRANHLWFPCLERPDERARVTLRVDVPNDLVTVGPGELESSTRTGDRRTDVWSMEFAYPGYLVSLVVGPLTKRVLRTEPYPVVAYYPQRDEREVVNAFQGAPRILDFYENYLGAAYPYPSYRQTIVRGLPSGAMENITSTIYEASRVLFADDREGLDDPTDIQAHEIAHQWFGDLLSPKSWADVWVSEGFASYLHLLYVEQEKGVNAFRRWMRFNREDALRGDRGARRRPIVWSTYIHPIELFDAHAYGAAAWRLHMLRKRVGDARFRRAVQQIVERCRGRSVDTEEIKEVLASSLGENLDGFFEQWFYGAGHPELECSWRHEENQLFVTLAQVQTARPWTAREFTFSTSVRVVGKEGERLEIPVEVNRRLTEIAVPLAFEPRWLRIDPDDSLYAEVSLRQSMFAWLAQLRDSVDPFARIDAGAALVGLLRGDLDPTARLAIIGALGERLVEDPESPVREGLAIALSKHVDAAWIPSFGSLALQDESPHVRRAAFRALGRYTSEPSIGMILKRGCRNERNPGVLAAAFEALGRARVPGCLRTLESGLDRDDEQEEVRLGLLRGLSALVDPNGAREDRIKEIAWTVLHSRRGERERALAVSIYKRCTRREPESRFELETLLKDRSRRVRSAAIAALGQRKDPASLPALIKRYRVESDPRVTIAMIELGRGLNERVEDTLRALGIARN